MDIKELRKTPAYQELRNYVNKHVPEAQRPYQLGQLAKRVLARFAEDDSVYFEAFGGIEFKLIDAFAWGNTPEGHGWWNRINQCRLVDDLNPCPIYKKGVPKVAKIAPKKRVGWWAA